MTIKRFDQSDLVYNTIKAHPRITFDIHNGSVYYQNERKLSGEFTDSINCVPTGHISLYEMNVDRDDDESTAPDLIHPFVIKDSSRTSFKKVDYPTSTLIGTHITSSYPMSATITREFVPKTSTFTDSAPKRKLRALKNTMNYNRYLSPHYAYSCSLSHYNSVGEKVIDYERDLDDMHVNAIYIPSIFYGSSIKKGSIDLKYYNSGSLIGRLTDSRQNGELIQVNGSTEEVMGVCLYDQGVILLTGSAELTSPPTKRWLDFAETAVEGAEESIIAQINFQGTSYTETITMLAHAEKAEMNHSNNQTYIDYEDATTYTEGSVATAPLYTELDKTIKNTVYSPYPDPTGSFEKITYISKIGVYDESKNLIGIATLATPVKKTEERDFTFKLKLDI